MSGDMDGWCFPSPASGTRNLVLMGGTGNGKSAIGNSILGRKAFTSKRSLSGVTSSSECQTATLKNGEVVNVIDTPGMFDFSVGNEEILKCVDLAKDGIDAVLLVFSVGARVTKEEATALESLESFFGPKIIEYVIVVFTGGDNLEEGDSLSNFLDSGPDDLQKILQLCNNRTVLFDNKTNDRKKKASQLQKLFSLVDKVVEKSNGQRYSYEFLKEIREVQPEKNTQQELTELMNKIQISCDEQIKQLQERMEKEIQERERQTAEQQAAHSKAQKTIKKLQTEVQELQLHAAEQQAAHPNAQKTIKKLQTEVQELQRQMMY